MPLESTIDDQQSFGSGLFGWLFDKANLPK